MLPDGVMVAQQFLVLLVWVQILVGQPWFNEEERRKYEVVYWKC
jgi:hypothetical protein